MKKVVSFVVFCLLLSNICIAQTKQNIVGVIPVKYSNKEYAENAEELTDIISTAFSTNKKVSVLARDKVADIKKELDLQKNIEYADGITVSQNKAHGAEMLIVGNLTKVDAVKINMGAGKYLPGGAKDAATRYKSVVGFSLQAFDVATGKLLESKTIEVTASDKSMSFGGVYEVEGDAKKNSVSANKKQIIEEVQEMINVLYPPAIKIATLDKIDKKGRVQLVSISGAKESDLDIKIGAVIIIKEVQELIIDDQKKTRETEVARLKATELQGDFIQCEVVKGDDVLQDKLKNAKLKYIVQSIDKK